MESTQKIIAGAALGTLLGSLAVVLFPRRYEIMEQIKNHSDDFNDLPGKAREFGESLLNSGKRFNFRRVESRDNYWKGGLLGLIVGVGATLLAAPSSGKNLRKQLSNAYTDLSEKSEEVIHHFKNNSHNPFAHTTHATASSHRNGVKKKPALKKAVQHKK
ncbi:MAG TPA: YtxH domain-containing protein [Parachlamydiaceae bacterium]|nr:YtxH domain-containing protein [Parachlamydiaceae bacterium]